MDAHTHTVAPRRCLIMGHAWEWDGKRAAGLMCRRCDVRAALTDDEMVLAIHVIPQTRPVRVEFITGGPTPEEFHTQLAERLRGDT